MWNGSSLGTSAVGHLPTKVWSDTSEDSHLHRRLNLDVKGLLFDSFHRDLHNGYACKASTVNVEDKWWTK